MKLSLRALVSATALAMAAGCAHPIKVAPDVAKLERFSTTAPRLTANVGYYIPPEVSSVEVTTAGGGGDNIRYYPYTDIEPGFEKPGIARGGTEYIVQPV